MSVSLCESYLRFDLPDGSRLHEDVHPNAETGVDIEIASIPAVWLEVKNWDAPVIPESQRAKVHQDVLDKTKTTSSFWDQLVAKFEGTYEFLSERGEVPDDLRLAVLLESTALVGMPMAPALSVLQSRLAKSNRVSTYSVALVNVSTIRRYIPDVNVKSCVVTSFPECNCAVPLHGCMAERRRHKKTNPAPTSPD